MKCVCGGGDLGVCVCVSMLREPVTAWHCRNVTLAHKSLDKIQRNSGGHTSARARIFCLAILLILKTFSAGNTMFMVNWLPELTEAHIFACSSEDVPERKILC